MEERGASAPPDVSAEQVRERTELEEKQQDNMLQDLQVAIDREKKGLALELKLAQIGKQIEQLGAATVRNDRRGVGSGGAGRGGVIVSGGLEA